LLALVTVAVAASFSAGVAATYYFDPSGTPKKLWVVHADNQVTTSTIDYYPLPGMLISGIVMPTGAKYLIVTISIQHYARMPEDSYIDLRLVVDGVVRDENFFSGRTHSAWQTHTAVFFVSWVSSSIYYHTVNIQWRLNSYPKPAAPLAVAAHRVLVVEAF